MKLSNLFQNLLTTLVSLFVCVAIAEVTLRLGGYEGNNGRINVQFDEHLGTIFKESWVYKVDFKNLPESYQFRDLRVVTDKKDKHRLLFIGDSGTFGSYVESKETFAYRFGQTLDHLVPNTFDVVNAGVVGMTTVGEYNLLTSGILNLQPDTVVLGLFIANDINFNLLHKQTTFESSGVLQAIEKIANSSAFAHFLYLKSIVL